MAEAFLCEYSLVHIRLFSLLAAAAVSSSHSLSSNSNSSLPIGGLGCSAPTAPRRQRHYGDATTKESPCATHAVSTTSFTMSIGRWQ
ncbi:hypothetical protein V5799_008703 [Amblyomma americanum]|uniref:Secreted protein n=1 Tax=Amblyomma americanum TaxID=6943 RepID=A0AAQ4FDL3_AMBAM